MVRMIEAVGLGGALLATPAARAWRRRWDEGGRGLSGGRPAFGAARVWPCGRGGSGCLLESPTASLDEQQQAEVIEALRALAASGKNADHRTIIRL